MIDNTSTDIEFILDRLFIIPWIGFFGFFTTVFRDSTLIFFFSSSSPFYDVNVAFERNEYLGCRIGIHRDVRRVLIIDTREDEFSAEIKN